MLRGLGLRFIVLPFVSPLVLGIPVLRRVLHFSSHGKSKLRSTAIKAVAEFTESPWWLLNKKCTCPQGRPPLHLLCPVVPGNIHQEQQEASAAPLHHWRETSEALSGSGEKQGYHRQEAQWSCQACSKEMGGEDCTVNICGSFTIRVNILVMG